MYVCIYILTTRLPFRQPDAVCVMIRMTYIHTQTCIHAHMYTHMHINACSVSLTVYDSLYAQSSAFPPPTGMCL